MKYIYHIARYLAAIIMLQTLYFKFSAHPESVELFTRIHMEPGGRILVGVLELVAGLLLMFGGVYIKTGAILGIVAMSGAIFFHLTVLGINQLLRMAIVTLVCCFYVLWYSSGKKL